MPFGTKLSETNRLIQPATKPLAQQPKGPVVRRLPQCPRARAHIVRDGESKGGSGCQTLKRETTEAKSSVSTTRTKLDQRERVGGARRPRHVGVRLLEASRLTWPKEPKPKGSASMWRPRANLG